MVIWFNVKEAREQLLNHGIVCTLRPKKRREGIDCLMYNGFGKKGTVAIDYWWEITDDKQLNAALEWSGFKSVADWRKAAGDAKYLYRVILLPNSCRR